MNKVELIQQIRFAIEQLKSSNSTMAFEHICRFFARARIVKNVIPATGPVQSHGDQGRDFETFHSYLSKSLINETCSLGFANKPIAFPCSLEKNPLKKNGKIDSDIKTILKSGTKVERIFFFSGEDIPVGSRHKKQQEVKKNFDVELEIIDAQAISEHLSDHDLFWIATQYLNIPSDFFPRENGENWYNKLHKEYQGRTLTNTYAEFNDIKSALRHIYKDELLKVDLPFWLEKMSSFLSDFSRELKRKAIYETFVAKLMGQNDVSGLESIIRDYFSDVETYLNPASLEDAQVLLQFIKNSKKVLGSEISDEEIATFQEAIAKTIQKELKSNISASNRCSYLEIQAHIIINEYIEVGDNFEFNVTGYVKKIREILPKLHSAPFFPLERLTERVLDFISLILELNGDPKKLDDLIKEIEIHLSKRHSELSIGENIRDRALVYMKNGKINIAISLLHQLKVKWFANEAKRGVILTSMLLGDCYSKLEMEYASKYYNLIAADMSMVYGEDGKVIDLLPDALKRASESAYKSGCWIHYLDLTYTAIGAYYSIVKDFDIYQDDEMSMFVFYPALIKHFANQFDMPVSKLIETKIGNWEHMSKQINEASAVIQNQGSLSDKQQISEALNNQLVGLPFNDIGTNRNIRFNIYGSDWNIHFENTYYLNAVAEQFVSMLQVYLVELSNVELFLTKSIVKIELLITKNSKAKFEQKPSNSENIWEIQIPFYDDDEKDITGKYEIDYFALIASVLRSISLLPDTEMKKILNLKMSEGLLNAITFGQTYQTLYYTYFTKESFQKDQRNTYSNDEILTDFQLKTNDKLPLNNSLSPTYSKEKNLEAIQKRVNHTHPFEITLQKMKSNDSFMKVINGLRANWLDWQIFMAFGNLMISYKISCVNYQREGKISDDELKNQYFNSFNKPEMDWYIEIPVELFSTVEMSKFLNHMNIATLLPSYELEFHSATPDCSAIKDLLVKRFNFMEDGKDIAVFN